MAKLDHFESGPDFAAYRPAGIVTREQAVQLVTNAIACAVEQRCQKLLVDIRGLTGITAPSLGARYQIVREWATAARGYVCVAIIIPAELADPQGFGITVARNMGMVVDRFLDEGTAAAWLRSLPTTE
jgi:hypothetical protein